MRSFSLSRLFSILLITAIILWLVIPFVMALLWSMVDPSVAWSYPDLLPPRLSFARWGQLWTTSSLPEAIVNSYSLAPLAALCSVILAMPTAYAFGRLKFVGKTAAQFLILIPLVMPSFVIAIFFTSFLYQLGVYAKYPAILLGHVVFTIPYAVRILTVSFAQVRPDVVHAARDLGANRAAIFANAYWPVIKPGIFAALLIVFILSIEEFSIAYVIGAPSFTTIPTILYSYLGQNFVRPNAATVTLILVVPNVIMMLFFERLMKSANPANVSGKG
jgi:putative spermidine/putrescine transport system permease protein